MIFKMNLSFFLVSLRHKIKKLVQFVINIPFSLYTNSLSHKELKYSNTYIKT